MILKEPSPLSFRRLSQPKVLFVSEESLRPPMHPITETDRVYLSGVLVNDLVDVSRIAQRR